MTKTFLFLTGLSGSGKGYFKENILPRGLFYPLVSMTTRKMRAGEQDGVDYYFKTEQDFEQTDFVTYLDVNKDVRQSGDPKWLYGVSEQEFFAHQNENLVYDVIEPKYVRQMLEWCWSRDMNFKYRVLFFEQQKGLSVAAERQNMKDDLVVRRQNTSTLQDCVAAGVPVDWCIINSKERMIFDEGMIDCINNVAKEAGAPPMDVPSQAQVVKDLKSSLMQKSAGVVQRVAVAVPSHSRGK